MAHVNKDQLAVLARFRSPVGAQEFVEILRNCARIARRKETRVINRRLVPPLIRVLKTHAAHHDVMDAALLLRIHPTVIEEALRLEHVGE